MDSYRLMALEQVCERCSLFSDNKDCSNCEIRNEIKAIIQNDMEDDV